MKGEEEAADNGQLAQGFVLEVTEKSQTGRMLFARKQEVGTWICLKKELP